MRKTAHDALPSRPANSPSLSPSRRADSPLARWLRKRHVFSIVLTLGFTLIAVSEKTYFDIRSSLERSTIFTESHVGALELFHLLTSAESAQFAFLTTGLPVYLEQIAEAEAAMPKAEAAAAELFNPETKPAMQARIEEIALQRRERVRSTLALARAGSVTEAFQAAAAGTQQTALLALRRDVEVQLASAARLQQKNRESIFRSLMSGRVAVSGLTFLALLSLLLYRRQLQTQDSGRQRQSSALLAERGQLERQVRRRTGQLTELTRHFQDTREEERALVARQLHDELGGVLTASTMEIARARAKVGNPEEILMRLDRVTAHLKTGIALKRRIIEDLRPSALTHLGLGIALQNICDETGAALSIPVRLSLDECVLEPNVELAVYRFVQESLANIGQHAGAAQAEVKLQLDENGLVVLEIRDDGAGFDAVAARAGGHGLASMRFRAESLGGSMRIQSAPGTGTVVRIAFPQIEFEPSLF
ncbi:MAG: sensor histidine kinase [Polaromonas sp.]|nr:sensor histidine kinase [Polaromonas sp.]